MKITLYKNYNWIIKKIPRLRQLGDKADGQDLQRVQPQAHSGTHATHHGLHRGITFHIHANPSIFLSKSWYFPK